MVKEIFVNLPVNDITETRDFWSSLGFGFNEKFSDEKAVCVVLGDYVYAMFLKPEFFQTFTTKTIIDAKSQVQVLNAISVESRELVDQLLEKGIAAGGSEPREPQDFGWMYNRALEDINGHIWEILFADPTLIPEGGPTA